MLSSFQELFDHVIGGAHSTSRYGFTVEQIHTGVTFEAGEMARRRGINYSIGWMEMLQLIAGVYDPEAIARVAPAARLELFTAEMAYGPRIVDQLPHVVEYLLREPHGRQAVLFIGKPEDGCTSNQPCTTAIHFLIRNGRLHANVSMRSWDVVKGLAYDVMMFGGLTQVLADILMVLPGYVTVTASSAHIYLNERDRRPDLYQPMFHIDERFGSLEAARKWALDQVATLLPKEVPYGILTNAMPVEAAK